MADGPKSSGGPSSYNSNIVLADGVDVISGHLEEDDECSTENQLVIRDALRLQRDLLQMNIAVPVKLKMVEKSIRDFRGFCAAAQDMQEAEASTTEKNGEDAAEQQSILSLLESVSTSAALYAKQLKETTPRSDALSSNDDSNKNDPTQQKRRAAKKQKKREQVDKLLERISQTPIELMFGVRIRRKYAEEIARRYGLEPQPYYADLSDSESLSSYSSLASSSDETTRPSRDGINISRINGKIVKKSETTNKAGQKATAQKAKNTSLPAPFPSPALRKADAKKRKKQSSTSESSQKSKGKKTVIPESEALDMLNWMDRLRMEMEQNEKNVQKSNGGGKPKAQSSQPQEDLSIPPEAMEILKEALVAATQDNSDEKLNEARARELATNFIQATAASAAASRMNPSTGGDSQAYPSSSSSAEIPGLSQDAAVEVWKEIQQYLRNLCISNPTAQELAVRTIAENKQTITKQKNSLPPAKTPPPSTKIFAKPTSVNVKKSKKRKSKMPQANPYPEAMNARRQQILQLQAEKQQEHAMVVAQLREQEAKLRDAVAAAASAQRSWINYRPVERAPFQVGQGPYGAVYQHNDFIISAHSEWLDERMITRGLRVYILIRALERHRLYDHCKVRRREAQFCLFLHCDKYRNGYLTYLCTGNEGLKLKSTDGPFKLKDTELGNMGGGNISFYETQCLHKPQWKTMEWERIKHYHRRFYSMDRKLPQLAGDFWLMLNQLHTAYESAIQYSRVRRRFTPLTKRIPPQCFKEIPRQLPFDHQRHSVELVIPKNYLLRKTPAEQRHLLRNLAQVSQKCLVVSRATFVDEERKSSVEPTKAVSAEPPKPQKPAEAPKTQTAKKRKKKK